MHPVVSIAAEFSALPGKLPEEPLSDHGLKFGADEITVYDLVFELDGVEVTLDDLGVRLGADETTVDGLVFELDGVEVVPDDLGVRLGDDEITLDGLEVEVEGAVGVEVEGVWFWLLEGLVVFALTRTVTVFTTPSASAVMTACPAAFALM